MDKTPTVEELQRRVAKLEQDLEYARRDITVAEQRLGEQLIGDLVELAKRARAEYEQRFAATKDPALAHLQHHANAYEFVAWQIKQFLEKRAAAAHAATVEAAAPHAQHAVEVNETVEAPEAPAARPSRYDLIDVD